MYQNLEGELRRHSITRQKIADDLKMNVSTVSRKLTTPGRLILSEAYLIRYLYCPDKSIEWLFYTTTLKGVRRCEHYRCNETGYGQRAWHNKAGI